MIAGDCSKLPFLSCPQELGEHLVFLFECFLRQHLRQQVLSSLLMASSVGPRVRCGVWGGRKGAPETAASMGGKCSAKCVEKNSTDTADGCVRLAKGLPGFIISVQKSIRKGLSSEAVIRGRILSVGLMVPWVWKNKGGITKGEPLTNCSACGFWPSGKTEDVKQAQAVIARGKQEEKNSLQLIAVTEREPHSLGLHITQSYTLGQHRTLPIPYPVALSCLNSCNATTLNVPVPSWRFRIGIWTLAPFPFC